MPRSCPRQAAQDNMMKLSSDVEKFMQWKHGFCHSNELKWEAACGGCWGTQCKNSFASVEGHNDFEDRFDNNIFDNIFGLWFLKIL